MSSIPEVKLKPRKYQIEAFLWAFNEKKCVIVLPTGTGKTLIAALWIKKLLDDGLAKQVLVLEPTRFLVEQISRFLRDVGGLDAKPIHGSYPKNVREHSWRSKVVVATPEIVLADMEIVEKQRFDAIVVDECHHTTGKDAYMEVMKVLGPRAEYRLGLSAYIPRSRIEEIEKTIGRIRSWSWSDPDVAPYIPPWIGEIYEVELNEYEKKVLKVLEELRDSYVGRLRGLVQNAIRWFVRDGALALRDSLSRETLLSKIIDNVRPYLEVEGVRPAHKLETLLRVLKDHEGFEKCIVFIDRVVVATYVYEKLKEHGYNAVLIRGRMRRHELLEALEKARSRSTNVVVSTSAGEEGIDLPEADVLVLWSITASPLRFIQRHGRVLRAREGVSKPKSVVYIVTLDTVDVDSLVDAIDVATKLGIDVPINRDVIESLWRRTTRSRIISALEGGPMPIEWLYEVLGIPMDILEKDLEKLLHHGDIVYIYTHLGKTYASSDDIDLLYEKFGEYLEPDRSLVAKVKYVVEGGKSWGRAITGNFDQVLNRLRQIILSKPIQRLLLSFQVEVSKGLIRLVNVNYSLKIDDERKLELILRNAFSVRKLVELGIL